MKVCWVSNAPSPYKVAFMNQLGTETELLSLFEMKAESDREKQWYDYGFHTFQAAFLDEGDGNIRIRNAADQCDLLICSDYSNRWNQKALHAFHRKKKPAIMHADGGLAIPRGLLDFAIRAVMKQYDWYLSSGITVNQRYFGYYHVPREKIFTYHFACMSEQELLDCAGKRLEKQACRKKIGISDKPMILSVGQQIPRKGYDLLVQAMEGIDAEAMIIGGTPEQKVQEYLSAHHMSNVHFLPFMNKQELSDYYAAADLFVLPTRYDIWGLVINEALSFGLPVLSTDRCMAAAEFAERYQAAEVIPAENADLLQKKIRELLEDEAHRDQLGKRAETVIRDWSYEQMVRDFISVFREIRQGG